MQQIILNTIKRILTYGTEMKPSTEQKKKPPTSVIEMQILRRIARRVRWDR